jgi:uncharacterized protein (TIGR00725 family)
VSPPSGPYVGVCGAGVASEELAAAAEEVGRLIATSGGVVVCGGLGGVMEAACRGAAGAGGVTIGLLPGQDRSAGNAYLTVALPTGMGELRNGLIVRAADVVVAIGGEWGTLSEIALARKLGRPVVALSTWDVPELAVVGTPAEAVAQAFELAR